MPQSKLPTRPALVKAADCLRTLGHPARLRMLFLLESGDYNVGRLAVACDISSHLASEHLRLMQRCGLLVRIRAGKETFYRIAEPGVREILRCVKKQYGRSTQREQKE